MGSRGNIRAWGVPGRRVCDSPALPLPLPLVAAAEGLDPNPSALKAPENVDRPSRFPALPPLASALLVAADATPVPDAVAVVDGLLLFLPWWEWW